MENNKLIRQMYDSLGEGHGHEPGVAHVEIHGNKVLGLHLVDGLEIIAEEKEEGIDATIRVKAGIKIEKPVKICFGLIPETGVQRINIKTHIEKNASIGIVASCTFPFAKEILHTMDAEIRLDEGAEYTYIERHVHGPEGGVTVIPRAKVILGKGARFRTDFELIKGRVGEIDIEYDAECHARSILEMSARISGRGTDKIRINEMANLLGEDAVAVLTTNIAVRDSAHARIENTIIASAAGTRGHVDCKEIIQGNATAQAIPIVDVRHAKAHVTHEAAIGSVDSKQLETLMARGLNEDDATDLIIEGLLRPQY
ncbi:SufD family Fe-S cluster assembly protein [bacterium]|nr:SufD family Fe-S cluster assembly protein [bacterium]